jgi:hypothetical protein
MLISRADGFWIRREAEYRINWDVGFSNVSPTVNELQLGDKVCLAFMRYAILEDFFAPRVLSVIPYVSICSSYLSE